MRRPSWLDPDHPRLRLAILVVSLMLALEGIASIAKRTTISTGFDAMAYVGAGLLVNGGRPTMYTLGFDFAPAGKVVYMPAFLYHPVVGSWYASLLRIVGFDPRGLTEVTNMAGLAVLFAGLAAALRAARWPLPAAAAAFWLVCHSFALQFAVHLGNLSPVVAGFGLLGLAALAGRRFVLAGALFAVGALFKPYFWLGWGTLLLFWRPQGESRAKTEFLAAWGLAYAAFSLVPSIDTRHSEFANYVSRLLTMGGAAWTVSFHDGSASSFLLKWTTPLGWQHYEMAVRALGNVEAQTGLWKHPRIGMANAAVLATAATFLLGLTLFRRRIALNPLGILAASLAAAMLIQPANWVHNYMLLVAVPVAIACAAPRRRRLAWIALAAAMLAMYSPGEQLRRWGAFPQASASTDLDALRGAWLVARVAGSVQTLALALLAVVPLLAGPGEHADEVDEPKPEISAA